MSGLPGGTDYLQFFDFWLQKHRKVQMTLVAMIFTRRLISYAWKIVLETLTFQKESSERKKLSRQLQINYFDLCSVQNLEYIVKRKQLRLERQIEIGIKCKNKKVFLVRTDKRIFFYKWKVHEKEMAMEEKSLHSSRWVISYQCDVAQRKELQLNIRIICRRVRSINTGP